MSSGTVNMINLLRNYEALKYQEVLTSFISSLFKFKMQGFWAEMLLKFRNDSGVMQGSSFIKTCSF